ncbi:MAG: hypothetical protein LAN83_00925 [Acidobacteriia bacterium]|nr:hypothetical protein [Terriglobia bacterium]
MDRNRLIIVCSHVYAGQRPDVLLIGDQVVDGKIQSGLVKSAACSECAGLNGGAGDGGAGGWAVMRLSQDRAGIPVSFNGPAGFYARVGDEWILQPDKTVRTFKPTDVCECGATYDEHEDDGRCPTGGPPQFFVPYGEIRTWN